MPFTAKLALCSRPPFYSSGIIAPRYPGETIRLYMDDGIHHRPKSYRRAHAIRLLAPQALSNRVGTEQADGRPRSRGKGRSSAWRGVMISKGARRPTRGTPTLQVRGISGSLNLSRQSASFRLANVIVVYLCSSGRLAINCGNSVMRSEARLVGFVSM